MYMLQLAYSFQTAKMDRGEDGRQAFQSELWEPIRNYIS